MRSAGRIGRVGRVGRAGRVAVAAAVLVSAGTALVGVGQVGAQESDPPTLYIRAVDSADQAATTVDFVYSGSSGDVDGASFAEDGTEITPYSLGALPGSTPVNVALIFDTSEAADTSGTLVNAKQAAKQLIASRSPEQATAMRFGVFLASATGELIQSYTNDAARLNDAIDRVGPSSDPDSATSTALWSAIRQAGDTLNGERGQANIVVMTAQNDNASGGDAGAAKGAVASAAASVFAVAFTGTGMDPGPLDSLVDTNGGQMVTTDDGNDVEALVESVGATITDGQYRLTYASTLAVGDVANLGLEVGDLSDSASAVVGGVTQGVPSLHQTGSSGGSGFGALQGNLFLYLGILLILIAVSGAAYALFLVVSKDDSLTRQLQPYAEYGGESGDDDEDDQQNMATSALMQRAVDITEQVASDRGLLARAEGSLERANLPLRAAEFIFFYFAGVIVFTLLMLVLTRSLIASLVVAGLAAMVPITVVNFLARRRKKQFLALLPDTLNLLAGTLRAGYSLMQGIEAVSQEVQEPMGLELRRVVTEARLGRPLEESLEGVAERMDSPDFAWAVMAIRIQREVGGNLSELLITVADTMAARERLRRDVATLTAEGRMSAIVLGLLPIGLGLIMWVMNPGYMGKLINTGLGNILLGLAAVSMVVGFLWMKKIINIEI